MQTNNGETKKILIVGGGTAGWMAANLFAKKLINKGFEISLLESSDIPTVGVGEGSTPYIKRFFDALDIEESEWMSACCATYKGGITFADWSTIPGHTSYFHPFSSSVDGECFNVFRQVTTLRHHGYEVNAHPNDYFLQTELVKQKRLPLSLDKQKSDTIYAYHFDASKLGEYLKKHAASLGVKHIVDSVTQVKLAPSGDISHVETKKNGLVEADIFVDCTGFSALLIQKTLGVPFTIFKDNLYNDAAVAIPSAPKSQYSPQTVATAMSNGWRWDIPLTTRNGNGYVYSSDFQSADDAEAELRRSLGDSILTDASARHIKMRVGRTTKHWHKNCVAIGLSQGFIEPLEATALHIVQLSIEQFIEQYEKGDYSPKYQGFYNDGVNLVFEHIRDYIVLHYLTNSRQNSNYWLACRNDIKISDSLQAIMEVWCQGGDLDAELKRQQITQYYSSMSWHVLLSGVGVFPSGAAKQLQKHAAADDALKQIRQQLKEHARFFPINEGIFNQAVV